MGFLSGFAFAGLAAIAVPIVVHLQKRKKAKITDWAAMQFLSMSIARRRKGIRLEHFLLLLCRCLLIATFVLAFARPVVQSLSDLRIPGIFIAVTIAIIAMIYAAIGTVNTAHRVISGIISAAFLAITFFIANFGQQPTFVAFDEPRDIAIVIDTSSSMSMMVDGKTNIERAIDEARELIDSLPGDSTVSLVAAGPITKQINANADSNLRRAANSVSEIEFTEGASNLQNAINQARRIVSNGPNAQKQVVAFTDEQLSNWEQASRDNSGLYERQPIGEESTDDKSCEFYVRAFPFPNELKNLSLIELNIANKTVSIHQPTNIELTVSNNGNQTVAEWKLELLVDGEIVQSKQMGQLSPGSRQVIPLSHQFKSAGYQAMTARAAGPDDIQVDNQAHCIVDVISQRKVLLVNGDFVNGVDEQSATFLHLALDPSGFRADPQSSKGAFRVDQVEVADLNTKIDSLNDYQAVVLCDVSRLPETLANSIAGFVAGGGGLMVFTGDNLETGFYNNWKSPTSTEFIFPFLIEAGQSQTGANSVGIDFDSVSNPDLQKMFETGEHDLTEFQAYFCWRIVNRPGKDQADQAFPASVRFANGHPFVSEFPFQKGRVTVVTSTLNGRANNMIQRVSFPVMAHLWINRLCESQSVDLNLPASANTAIKIPGDKFQSMPDSLVVSTPNGTAKEITTNNDDKHLVCMVGETATPGLYTIKSRVSGLEANDDKAVVPFSILTDQREYELAKIGKHKFDEIAQELGCGWINEPQQLAQVATGTVGIIELWKYLVFSCLFFVVCEAVVQRWIVFRRRAVSQKNSETLDHNPPPLPATSVNRPNHVLEEVA